MSSTRGQYVFAPTVSRLEDRKLLAASIGGGTLPPGVQAFVNELQTVENNLLNAASHTKNHLVSSIDTGLAHAIQNVINNIDKQYGVGTNSGGTTGGGGGNTIGGE